MASRTGATRRADIPADILAQLNAGVLETRTLAEGLAIDLQALLSHAAPELSRTDLAAVDPGLGIVKRVEAAGLLLARAFGAKGLPRFFGHGSDTIRGCSAYMLAALPGLSLEQQFERLQPLADDPHFGVREWAWMAIRPRMAQQLDDSLTLLAGWTRHASANVRRFASESTRPRGVWCAHLEPLKQQPARGRPLLEPLRADPSKYVQDSVGNWLNDAAKSQPDWVRRLCREWLRGSPSPATKRICERGQRSLK